VLGIIGQIALVLFMFLVGLGLDFHLLKGRAKGILSVSVAAVGLPALLGLAIGPVLYNSDFAGSWGTPDQASRQGFSLFLAAMLTVTAFPVMARILQEKRLTDSPMGSIGVAAAAVVTVLMFLAVAVAAGTASGQGPDRLVVKFVLAGAYLAVMFGLVRPMLAPLGRRFERAGTTTPGIFAAVLIVAFASSYVADRIGVNVIVGGFVAGAVLPAREALFREMTSRLGDLTGVVLLPVFLAFAGLNTDFTRLSLSVLPGIGLFLLAGIVGKWAGGAVGARVGGLSWQEGNVLGVLMNCRGLLVLVVGLIAAQAGVISPVMQVGSVLMALLTTAMTGPLVDRFLPGVPGADRALPAPASGPLDAYRVLVVIDDLDRAPLVTRAAFALVGDQTTAEVVLVRLFPFPAESIVFDVRAEVHEALRSMRVLRAVSSWPPSGVTVTPIAFATTTPADDLARLVVERRCDVVIAGWPLAGYTAHLDRLGDETGAVVVTYVDNERGEDHPDGPVLLAGAAPDGRAEALARHLASGLDTNVDRVAGDGGAADLVAASQGCRALVLFPAAGADGRLDPGVVDGLDCPMYVISTPAASVVPAHLASEPTDLAETLIEEP
jgi:Kef-type K+ transport system membrane component KefB